MKYTSETLKYIAKNFVYVILFAAIPALFFALSVNVDATKSVLNNLLSGNPRADFWDIFHTVSVFNFSSSGEILSGLTGIVALVLCVAMLTAFLEKHMRIGKKTWNGLLSKVNDNLLSSGGLVLLFLIVYELWAVVTSALWYFVTGIPNVILAYVLLVIVYFVMHFVLLYGFSTFYLWLPCVQITGFNAFDALSYSYRLLAPIQVKLVVGQTAFLLVCEALLAVIVALVRGEIAFLVVATVLYTAMILIYCVRMLIVYFDRAQLDRADLKKYY